MKKFFVVFFLMILTISVHSQEMKLPTQWKFQTGDNAAYKETNFDDSQWKLLTVPGSWQSQGYKDYYGYAWYRVQLSLPANLRGQDLMLELGSIGKVDATYCDGVLIGCKGKFLPDLQSSSGQSRKYKIPKELAKNKIVIAIRVYADDGEGGIYTGNLKIYPYKIYEAKRSERLKNKHSYNGLTTSNGLISAVYNSRSNVIEDVYPYTFRNIDSATMVKPYITNLKCNRQDKPISVKYLDNTHVIQVKYADLTLDYFASFVNADKVFYVRATGAARAVDKLSFAHDPSNTQLLEKTIRKGNEKYFLYSFNDSLNNNTAKFTEAENCVKTKDCVAGELTFMKTIFSKCHIPKSLSIDEKNIVEQGISILKMSQVSDKEVLPLARGQILASLRPGVWAITWVRDGSYSMMAMAKLGMYDEARKGLEFMLEANSNRFKNYIYTDGKNYGPEVDYQISLTRYFGNGTEECDYNDHGPNIEYDDWGLFLMALHAYVTESHDWAFYKKWQPLIQSKIADAIVSIIQSNNLLKQDSGPWEHHLPGQQFAYTNGVNCVGLKEFAELQKHEGLESEKYSQAAQRIYKGVMEHMLVNNEFIKGNAEEMKNTDHYYYDGGVFELFSSNFINDKKLFESHMKVYDKQLKVNSIYGTGRGYIRFNSQDSYENQEWPFANLRVAVAQNKFGNRLAAKQLIDRITSYAHSNCNQVPEILTNEEVQYSGAIPMVGYGSGAYILSVLDYYK